MKKPICKHTIVFLLDCLARNAETPFDILPTLAGILRADGHPDLEARCLSLQQDFRARQEAKS